MDRLRNTEHVHITYFTTCCTVIKLKFVKLKHNLTLTRNYLKMRRVRYRYVISSLSLNFTVISVSSYFVKYVPVVVKTLLNLDLVLHL